MLEALFVMCMVYLCCIWEQGSVTTTFVVSRVPRLGWWLLTKNCFDSIAYCLGTGRTSVLLCRLSIFVILTHPVTVFNASFYSTCSLFQLVALKMGDHIGAA